MTRERVQERLAEVFGRWAGEHAIEFVGQAAPHIRTWSTWGDLAAVRDAIADALSARSVPAESAVAIVMRQRPAMVGATLGVMSLGRTALLVSPLQADRALAAEVAALRVAVLVADATEWERPAFADAVAAGGALGISLGGGGVVDVRVDVASVQAGPAADAAVTVLTSGTTGPAKRLPVDWKTFVELGGGPSGRDPEPGRGALILSLPLVTLGGLLSMARLVFTGRPMAMMERFDVHTWAALVREHRPTVMGAPPPVVQMILDADISPDHFEGVTAYTTSSAAIPADTIRRFEARYGIPVLLGYGATEFLNSVSGWTPALWSEFRATKVGSVGRALRGVRLRVVDAECGAELGAGAEGILEVDPPQRAWHLPDGWLRTADRARIDADGFLWILGRSDDVIVRGGFKVDLAMIESSLVEHPAVEAAAAIGLSDARLGQVPAALVVLVSGSDVVVDDLLSWIRDRLPGYATPTTIRIADAIPLTPTLKPDRAEVTRALAGP